MRKDPLIQVLIRIPQSLVRVIDDRTKISRRKRAHEVVYLIDRGLEVENARPS